MSLVAYNGVSAMSRAILFFNDGIYSHASWLDDDVGDVYEAWTTGVRKAQSVHHGHNQGTAIDVFQIEGEDHYFRSRIRHFMISQLGKPYDWPGVFRFVTRGAEKDPNHPDKWFCSRLVAAAYRSAGLPLLRAPDWKMNPTDCTYSLRCPPVPTRSFFTADTSLLHNRSLRGQERYPEEILYPREDTES